MGCEEGSKQTQEDDQGSVGRFAGRFLIGIPLTLNISNHVFGSGRVQPKDLNRIGSSHLHLQSAAHWREFQVRFAGPDRRDHTQCDLGHVRAFFRRLDNRNRRWDHGGVLPVELRTAQQTFGVGHGMILAPRTHRVITLAAFHHLRAISTTDRASYTFVSNVYSTTYEMAYRMR